MSIFKTLASAKRTGAVATIEVYELNDDLEPYEDIDKVFILTRTGIVREVTENGNKKISDDKAIALTGNHGLGWLHNLYKKHLQNPYYQEVIRFEHNDVFYEAELCEDLEVYCEEDDVEYEVIPITSLDLDIAEDLHNKEAFKAHKGICGNL